MRVQVLSINGKREEYEVDAEMPVAFIGVDEDESLLYNSKRLVLCCQKCKKHLTFGDLSHDDIKLNIQLYRKRHVGGPRVEQYVFPTISGVLLIRTDKMCNVCQSAGYNNIALAGKSIDILTNVHYYGLNGYNINASTLRDATEITGATVKNFIPANPGGHIELDISKSVVGDIVTIRVSTTTPKLTSGIKFDISSTLFLEYRIKLVEPYWTTKTSILFPRDQHIRKELLALQSVFRFPKDIILYIGRFL